MNLKFTQSNYFKSSIVNFFIINSGNLFTYLSIFLIGRNLSIKELSIWIHYEYNIIFFNSYEFNIKYNI